MAAGLIAQFEEERRQVLTGDADYAKRMPPIFELRVPPRAVVGGNTSFMFPLPMPPQTLDLTYPFALDITPSLGAGVVVEQSGILMVEIRLAGTMGQKTKAFRGSNFGKIGLPNARRGGREVSRRSPPGSSLSGHRYLLHLRDSVFQTYSDLKQDPETAEDTQLILHLPKEGEHYVVEPRSFTVPRRARESWHYQITLVGVAMAKALPTATEDKSLLEQLLDAPAQARKAIRLAQASMQELAALRSDIESTFRSVVGVIDDVSSLLDETTSFITGTKDRLEVSRDRVLSAAANLERAAVGLYNAGPDELLHALLEIGDSIESLAVHSSTYEPGVPVDGAFRSGLGLLSDASTPETSSAATTYSALRTTAQSGDSLRDQAAREVAEEFKRYGSSFTAQLRETDTLEGLAAKYLGDARLWRHIALVNNLAPPYISDNGEPGTLGPGDTVLIPSEQRAEERRSSPAVLGAPSTAPIEVRELGTDFQTIVDPVSGLEDWAIDTEGGAEDVLVAEGAACLVQDLRARMRTERGTDALYPSFGVVKSAGLGIPPESQAAAGALRVVEALEADPRVEQATASVTISGDTASTEAQVQVRRLRETLRVQASTPVLGRA